MRVLKGRQKIGSIFNKIDLYLDFNDITFFKGERESRQKVEKIIGGILICTGIVIAILFFLNSTDDGINKLTLASATFPLIAFGIFLLRDRNEFDINLKKKKLHILKSEMKNKEIEIDDFMSNDLLALIDEGITFHYEEFIFFISNELVAKANFKKILEARLGVNVSELIKQFNILKGMKFDQVYQHFFLELFECGLEIQSDYIDAEVLLCVMLKDYWIDILREQEVLITEINALQVYIRNKERKKIYNNIWKRLSKLKPTGAINRSYTSRATPLLDNFSTDLTSRIIKEGFSLTIGKDQALNDIEEALSKNKNSAALLIGVSGIGKTELLKHFVSKLVVEDVSPLLQDKRAVLVDISKMIGTSDSEHKFLNNLVNIFSEIRNAGNIILIIEEIFNIFTLSENIRGEVLHALVSALENDSLKIVATSTKNMYAKFANYSPAFIALFDVIEMFEPDVNETIQIVLDVVPEFEVSHKVVIEFSAIKILANIGRNILYEKAMPLKAIQLLEKTILNAKSKGLKHIDKNIAEETLEEFTRVPIGELDASQAKKIIHLGEKISKKVIGQAKAIDAISSAIARYSAGISNKNKPVASFLFYGPTGVGKTYVAKMLAEYYFGSENLFTKLNMSEYSDEAALKKLLGYFDAENNFIEGVLTSPIKSKPYSLLLLDEIEKASKESVDLFLQILDDGYVTDNYGTKINFRNCIIIFTSNSGAKLIINEIQKNTDYYTIEKQVMAELYKDFRVEFLNRFDKLVMFNPLSKIEIKKIVGLQLNEVKSRLEEQGIIISWNDKTETDIVDLGYSAEFGARAIRRTIQDKIENKIAAIILEKHIDSGSQVVFDGLQIKSVL